MTDPKIPAYAATQHTPDRGLYMWDMSDSFKLRPDGKLKKINKSFPAPRRFVDESTGGHFEMDLIVT